MSPSRWSDHLKQREAALTWLQGQSTLKAKVQALRPPCRPLFCTDGGMRAMCQKQPGPSGALCKQGGSVMGSGRAIRLPTRPGKKIVPGGPACQGGPRQPAASRSGAAGSLRRGCSDRRKALGRRGRACGDGSARTGRASRAVERRHVCAPNHGSDHSSEWSEPCGPPPLPYKVKTSRPSLRTNWTRLVPFLSHHDRRHR